MTIYRVQGPDGKTYRVEGPEGATPESVLAFAKQHFDKLETVPDKKDGITGALAKGAESLISSARTAAGATFGDATEAAREGVKRGEDIDNRYADQVGWDKVVEKYRDPKGGFFPAAGEVLRQAPYAIAEQVPNIATALGGARIGATAGSLLGPAGTGIGAVVGAVAPSFIQQLGGNLERQAQENPTEDVKYGRAAAAAVPQAALDAGANYLVLGKTVIGKALGPKITALLESNPKAAEALAKQGLAKTLGKGVALGAAAEVPTEILQQVIERAQAGLPLTSDDALAEYGETAYRTGLSAGPFGAAGKVADRSAARGRVKDQEEQAAIDARLKQRQTTEAQQDDPTHWADVEQKYKAAQAQFDQMRAALPKATKGGPAVDEVARKEATQALGVFGRDQLAPLAREYAAVRPKLEAARAKQAAQGVSPEDFMLDQLGIPQLPVEQTEGPASIEDMAQEPAQPAKPNPFEFVGNLATKDAEEAGREAMAPEDQMLEAAGLYKKSGAHLSAEENNRVGVAVGLLRQNPELMDQFLNDPEAEIPGLTARDNYNTRAKLKEAVKAQLQAELGQRQADLKNAKTTPDKTPPLWQQQGAELYDQEPNREVPQFKYEEVFGKDETVKTPLEDTAKQLAGEKKTDPLQNAEIRDAKGERLPAQHVRGQAERLQTFTVDELKAQLKSLLQQREAMRQGQMVQKRAEGYVKPDNTEEGQQLRNKIDETIERLRVAQSDPRGRWFGPLGGYDRLTDLADQDQWQDAHSPFGPERDETDYSKDPDYGYQALRESPSLVLDTGRGNPSGSGYGRVIDRVAQPEAQRPPAKRAPGPGFQLYPSPKESAPGDIGARIEGLLANRDLNPQARGLLEKISQQLPKDPETLSRIGEMLRRIETMGEGQGPLDTRKPARTEKTLRAGKPIAAKPLTDDLQDTQTGAEDTQTGNLFSEEEAPAARNKYELGQVQRTIAAAKQMQQANERLPALMARLQNVQKRLAQAKKPSETKVVPIDNPVAERVRAKGTEEANRAIEKITRLLPERGQLQETLDELNALKAAGEAADANITADYQTNPQAEKQLDTLIAQFNLASKSLSQVEQQLEELDTLIKIRTGKVPVRSAGYKSETTPAPNKDKVRRLEKEEREAKAAVKVTQEQYTKADTEAKRVEVEERQAEEAKQRGAEQEARTKSLDEKAKLKEAQVRAQKPDGATRVEGISEAQRAARERAEAARTDETSSKEVENTDKKNPVRVKGALEKQRRALTSRIESEKQRVSPLYGKVTLYTKQLESLEAQFKEAKSADAREDLINRIDVAQKNLRDAQEKNKGVAVTYPGMAADMKALAALDNRLSLLEDKIEKYRAKESLKATERRAFAPIKKKLEEQARQNKEEATEAASRAGAPKVDESGIADKYKAEDKKLKAVTRTSIEEARKQGPTAFKGNLGSSGKEAIKSRQEAKDEVQVEREQGKDTARVRKELDEAFPHKTGYNPSDRVQILATAKEGGKGIPEDAKGFVKDGVAYLIAENIQPGQALGVLLHELGAHIGMRNFFTPGEYKALVKAVQSWANKGEKTNERKIYDRVQEALRLTPKDQLQDETIAHAVEAAISLGVKPELNGGAAAGWVKRVVDALKRALGKFLKNDTNVTPKQLVDMAYGAAHMELSHATPREGSIGQSKELLFSRNVTFPGNLKAAGALADSLVAQDKGVVDRAKKNLFGLGFRTQFVDSAAPLEKLAREQMDALKGTQMMYYMRMFGQRMNFVSQAAANGVPKLVEKSRKDGQKEWMVESSDGNSLKDVVTALKPAAKKLGDADTANRLFTVYLAAKRAERVGLDVLDKSGNVTKDKIDAAMAEIKAAGLKDTFEDARQLYNDYNKGLIDFAVQTGALSKDIASKLSASGDYVPYYRERGGNYELIIGNETPVRIGNVKDAPHLKELLGGDTRVLDFMTSSVQNTSMLLDMSLRNLATKNAVYELRDLGMATIGKKGLKGDNVVHFFDRGEEKSAMVDTERAGIPSDLLVKGMAGIPTMVPAAVRLMGIPAKLLRKAVTLSPLYAGRQLFRDSLASVLVTGANTTPVLSALKQIGKTAPLQKRGVTGGQIITGTNEDITTILRQIADGKDNVHTLIAKAEALSMEADAASRMAQYKSLIDQGMSEMEATYAALESMNFNKRGVSPSMHLMSTLIPFFNAQIQGLDVLYKAFRGNAPFNEKLKIREKLWARGLMIASASMAYAALMQDDDAYKNADPETKYGNWFVRIPGVDQPVRIPIPFELGYIFKALPEAIVNIAMNKNGAEDAQRAFINIAKQIVPGGTNYGMPQAIKPMLETAFNKSFYTGRDIETPYERTLLPEARFRENTSEVAKLLGNVAGVSPVMLDSLVRGYTGSMGLAFVQALGFAFPHGESPEKATKRWSDQPVIGPLFQPTDGLGIVNAVYEKTQHLKQVKATFDEMVNTGRRAEAQAFLQEHLKELVQSEAAGDFTSEMKKLSEMEKAVRSAPWPADEKRQALDRIRKMKIEFAKNTRAVLDR